MVRSGGHKWNIPFFLALLLLILSAPSLVRAQGIPEAPFSAPDVLRRGASGLDLAPSNPLGLPGSTGGFPRGSDSIYLTDQIFRDIFGPVPHLQLGYLFSFGPSVKSGRLSLDYLLPIQFGNSAVFAETHTEFQDFWKTVVNGANNRVDFSIGGGYRTIFGGHSLVGVNGFYDGTRLGGIWYNSGGVGAEFAALLAGHDAVDLTFNWYGNLFNSNVIANAFRNGPQNYDFQAGYSHELWDGGPDLRLSATGYRFAADPGVYGSRAAAELRSRDAMFVVKSKVAHDRINNTYNTVAGFVNVGLRLENTLSLENPFVPPEPIFRSPRSLRWLLQDFVKRTFSGPTSIVVSKSMGVTCGPVGTASWPRGDYSTGGPFIVPLS